MTETSGTELEDDGQRIFQQIGVACVHRLNQTPLQKLDPSGPHSVDEHLEFDYLIPVDNVCLFGEITARTRASDIISKYGRFRTQFSLMMSVELKAEVWSLLGVPEERLREFRDVTELKAFFIVTRLEHFDVNLPNAPKVACFYKTDWNLLENYAECIGKYTRPLFLDHFGLRVGRDNFALIPKVMPIRHKIVASNIPSANLYTFEVSPYDLLPAAQVFRRDLLPDLSPEPAQDYQRPLVSEKLKSIRKTLLTGVDFMFPNNILVVLSNGCKYSDQDQTLQIPTKYGSISVIDGQHRLFSYADQSIENRLGRDIRIMVTAIEFEEGTREEIEKYSARAFIEINMNQTRVSSSHLDAIAYQILGDTYPKALAAEILLQVNGRQGKLHGLLATSQTSLGIIKATTVVSALKTVTNVKSILRLQSGRSATRLQRRRGYENLFEGTIDELANPDKLIQLGVACIERYFNGVESVFSYDWPKRGRSNGSSLEYTKFFSAFVKLLDQFISEGLNWTEVHDQLVQIHKNVVSLRGTVQPNKPLFDHKSFSTIPDARPSVSEDFLFLNLNRVEPTSIDKARRDR